MLVVAQLLISNFIFVRCALHVGMIYPKVWQVYNMFNPT